MVEAVLTFMLESFMYKAITVKEEENPNVKIFFVIKLIKTGNGKISFSVFSNRDNFKSSWLDFAIGFSNSI